MKASTNSSAQWLIKITLLLAVILTACSAPLTGQQAANKGAITVYKSATCGCCSQWSGYLQEAGFEVLARDVDNLGEIKDQYLVPIELRSCHTALIDGYVVEGHVPAGDIERLLLERPDIIGIAVAGMPPGSPGMEIEGADAVPYNVVAFDASGSTELFASYP